MINLFSANFWSGSGIYNQQSYTQPSPPAMSHTAESDSISLDLVAYAFLLMVLLFLFVPCILYVPSRFAGGGGADRDPVLRYTIVRRRPGRDDEREDIFARGA